MAGGIESEQLHVEHDREPGEWVPVAPVIALERVGDAARSEAVLHDLVSGHVAWIVVTDEVVTRHGPIRYGGGHGEYQRYEQNEPSLWPRDLQIKLRHCGTSFHGTIVAKVRCKYCSGLNPFIFAVILMSFK